ncbi:MAG: AAA family ATP:ADP antiporter, partial [Gammaproteobacteria bacterium]
STGACMAVMVLFWLSQPDFLMAGLPYGGILFYLWVGMFGVFVIAQFWAFAADLFTDDRGRRLMPVIAIGATLGAVVGSWVAKQLVSSGALSSEYLLLATLVPLSVSIWLTRAAHAEYPPTSPDPAPTKPAVSKQGTALVGSEEPDLQRDSTSSGGALKLILRTKILLMMAVITLLTNWVNTNGENLLFGVIQEAVEVQVAEEGIIDEAEVKRFVRDRTTAFYSNFFFWVNILALFLQAVVVSRMLKYGGFALIYLALPVIALVSYSIMALVPILMVIKVMKIAENSTDYSVSNTARHVFWLPFDASTTYKGKPAVDSMFVRMGDGLAALTVLVGVQMLDLSLDAYLILNVILVVLWLGLAIWLVKAHSALRESASLARS